MIYRLECGLFRAHLPGGSLRSVILKRGNLALVIENRGGQILFLDRDARLLEVTSDCTFEDWARDGAVRRIGEENA